MTIKTNLDLILCYSDELERPAHLMDAPAEEANFVLDFLDDDDDDDDDDDSTIDTCFDCDSTISDQSSLLGSIEDEEIYSDDEQFEEQDSLVFARRNRRELRNQIRSTTTAADDIFSLQDSLVLSRRSNQTNSRRFNGEESYIFDDDSFIQSRNRFLRPIPLVRSSEKTDIVSGGAADEMEVVLLLGEFEGLMGNFDNGDDSEDTVWPLSKQQQLLEPTRRRRNNRRKANRWTHQGGGAQP